MPYQVFVNDGEFVWLIVGLVSLNRLSFAISKIPSLLSKDEGCGGFNKFPMPHKPPTVMKEMAIIAIMLFRIIFLLITPYFQFDQEIDGRKVRYFANESCIS